MVHISSTAPNIALADVDNLSATGPCPVDDDVADASSGAMNGIVKTIQKDKHALL